MALQEIINLIEKLDNQELIKLWTYIELKSLVVTSVPKREVYYERPVQTVQTFSRGTPINTISNRFKQLSRSDKRFPKNKKKMTKEELDKEIEHYHLKSGCSELLDNEIEDYHRNCPDCNKF